MKKKIFVLLAIFALMNFGQGCFPPEHYLIIDIDFNAALIEKNDKDKQAIHFACTSTIKDRLIFIISYETEYLYGYISNFGNVCYATSKPRVNDNEVLRNTFSITFDKEFSYNGNTISSMTNIFEIDAITKEIDEYKNSILLRNPSGNVIHADIVLDFSDKFFKNSVFDPTKEYIVTFSCETSDEKFFKKTIMIKFEK